MNLNLNKKNINFPDLRDNLNALRDARVDLVVDSGSLYIDTPGGITTPAISDAITARGVGLPKTEWELTPHAFRQWCAKFNVPSKYLGNLIDWTENSSFHHLGMDIMHTHNRADSKPLLIRGLLDPEGESHIARAILSPSYSFIENYDVLTAVLQGFSEVRKNHNIGFEPDSCSLSDRHMRVRFNMPSLRQAADALLKDYRSPYSGASGTDNPIVFMGIEIRNSEVGAGSFTIVPVIVIEVCNNGMTLTKDIFRKVHLGSAMEYGEVSQRTMSATMELITAQTVDKVVEIANPAYLQAKIDEFMELKRPVIPVAIQT